MPIRLYVYVSGSMIARGDVAFVTVVERMRDTGIEVVDFDELSRRIVFRAPSRLASILGLFLKKYAASHTVEVKASARASLRGWPQGLRRVRVGDRVLFFAECGRGLGAWGEYRGRRLLLKLCRSGVAVDPAQMPSSLCIHPGGDPVLLVEEATECFNKVIERLAKQASGQSVGSA